MAIKGPITAMVGTLLAFAALTAHADVPITPTHCTGRFCIATYETKFSLQQIRTLSNYGTGESTLMMFKPSLVAAIVLGDKVGACQSSTGKISLRRKGDTYLGSACFQVPANNSHDYVAVGIAIKTTQPIEDYLGFDGLCIWVKEPVAGGITGTWAAQRLGPMRCVAVPNNSFKPKPLRGSA